jgi:hypothetical protein
VNGHCLSIKKAPQRALLLYCVGVFLLTWWPWNVWLVIGAAYASRLKRRNNGRLFTTDARETLIGPAQGIEEALTTRNGLNPSRDRSWIAGDQHFGHTPGQPLIDGIATARRAINQRSIHNRTWISERVDTATGEAIGAAGQTEFSQLPRRR